MRMELSEVEIIEMCELDGQSLESVLDVLLNIFSRSCLKTAETKVNYWKRWSMIDLVTICLRKSKY
jgi:hypothetical protein